MIFPYSPWNHEPFSKEIFIIGYKFPYYKEVNWSVYKRYLSKSFEKQVDVYIMVEYEAKNRWKCVVPTFSHSIKFNLFDYVDIYIYRYMYIYSEKNHLFWDYFNKSTKSIMMWHCDLNHQPLVLLHVSYLVMLSWKSI